MSSVLSLEHIFEKAVSKTDVNHRFAYPIQHLHHICPYPYENRETPTDFVIVDGDRNGDGDGDRKRYLFRLTVRRRGYLKPEITGDWLRFVIDKNINPLDVVIFKKHNPVENGVVFTVTVRRAFFICPGVLGNAQLA